MMTDPISDFLTRIRNASLRKYEQVDIPHSRLKKMLSQLFLEEGFILGFEEIGEKSSAALRIRLKYHKDGSVINGLQRISKPGLRVYVKKEEVPKVRGGLGTAILSTTEGVLTDKESRNRGVGGEVLCYIW